MPNCVFQDTFGFIWIGDQEGLLRYDGYNLKRFKQTPFDTTSLSNNFVIDIEQDKNGNLWIATLGGGLNYFNQKTELFSHYLHDPKDPASLGSNRLTKIIVNDDGSLWIGTLDNGFTIISWDSAGKPKYRQYIEQILPPDKPWNTILDMYKDTKGNLWIGTEGLGLQRLNIASGEIKSYQTDKNNPFSISDNFVSSICEDDSGSIWIGTGSRYAKSGGGLNRFDPKSEKFTHFRHQPGNPRSLSSDIINALMIDRDNGFWIGTSRGGLNYLSLSELYNQENPKFRKVREGSYSSIYEDSLGNVWICPSEFYVYKYDYRQNPFVHFRHKPDNPNSLSHNSAHSLFLDKTYNLWIGHGIKGITVYNLKSKKYRHYKHDPQNTNTISENFVKALCADNNDNIWIGTANSGIDIFNPANETFRHIKANPNDSTALASNLIQILAKRFNGDIWIVSKKGGLQLYDSEHKQFLNFDPDPNSIEDESIYALCEDGAGRLWLGTTNNGLYNIVLNGRNLKSVKHYSYNALDPSGLNNNTINDIMIDEKQDVLWITTNGGLNRMDLSSGLFDHITEKDGLPTNFVMTMLQDNLGRVWMTTTNGISRYNPQTGKIINYDKADGLPHTHFGGSTKRNVKTTGDTLFFGGRGVIAFNRRKIIDNPNIPPIKLTSFKINNKHVRLDTAIHSKKNINLNYDQNAFSFEFSALNYTNPAKNQYAYKLEGFHDDWIYTGNKRTASFTNLDPGEYIFKAKGSNNHGIWNEQGTSIKITILPPWWKTWWAYASYLILILILLNILRKYDLKRQHLKNELALEHKHSEKLREIDRMKSRFFANISHEFRTPLTLILGPIDKLLSRITESESRNELTMMQRNAKRLQRLINQLLDLSSLESGAMTIHVKEENIVKLVNEYVQSFESLAQLKGIELKFNAEDELIPLFVDRDKIEKILSNLLSNALKFTAEGGMVEVSVSGSRFASVDAVYSNRVVIKVSDTGTGISSNRIDKIFDRFYQIDDSQKRKNEGTGIGLALTKELVKLHHGQITVDSRVGKGTTFSIYLPAGKDHFKNNEIIDDIQDADLALEKEDFATEETAFESANYNEQHPGRKTDKSIILIVDDNPDMRAYIRGYLDNNYKMIEAEDGQKGFDKATDTIPDLIISDVMMPKMGGFELCDKIKTDERTSHIPLILLTARAESVDRIEGLQTGADDYLIKPFDSKELQVRINNLIEQREKLRERFYKEVILGSKDISVVSIDEKFIYRLIDICHKHMADSKFSIESIGLEVGLSRSQLYRKLKGLTGKSATDFLKTLRLKRAALLMLQHQENISQIAYEVGFNNLSYFAKSFKELFGKTPSEYLKSIEQGQI